MRTSHQQRQKTQTNYDRLSGFYDLLSGSSERACRVAGLELLAVHPGERILEIGAGTGAALPDLAGKLAPDGMASGLDLSPGMLRVAQQRLRRAGIQAGAGLAQGDAAAIPFANGIFDGIFMAFTLELFTADDSRVVLAECRRVLRPGGRLAVVSLGLDARGFFSRGMLAIYRWSHRVFPTVVDCRPIEAGALLHEAGFATQIKKALALWGLPVSVALALKHNPGGSG